MFIKSFKKCAFFWIFYGIMTAYAQAPDSLWKKVYGNENYERGKAIIETTDGGFSIIGETNIKFEAGIFNNGDIWLVKVNSEGDTIWTKTFSGSGIDEGNSIQQTSDNGFIIAGAKSNNISIYDAWLIRTDNNGDTIWTKTIGSSRTEEYAVCVKQTNDGGFILTGYNNDDLWLVNTDSSGDIIWTKSFGGDGSDIGNSVMQTSDGGFLVTGSTREIGKESELWLVRTDANGDTIWTKKYNGQKSFNSVDKGMDILPAENDNYYILGQAGVNVWMLKINNNGDTLWTKQYIGTGNDFNFTIDGGFIIVGGISIIHTNQNGELLWEKNIESFGKSVKQTADGKYYIAGHSFSSNTKDDLMIYCLGKNEQTAVNSNKQLSTQFNLSQNYPNPFNPTTKFILQIPKTSFVSLKLYDVSGREVKNLLNEIKSAGQYEIILNAKNLSTGVYYCQFKNSESTITKKIILIK